MALDPYRYRLPPGYGDPGMSGSALPYTQMQGAPGMPMPAGGAMPGGMPDAAPGGGMGFPASASQAPSLPRGMFGPRPETGINAVDQGSAPPSFTAPQAGDIDMSGMPKVRPHFFDKGGLGQKIAGVLGEVGMRLSASQGDPMSMMLMQQRMMMQRYGQERGDKLADDDREFEQQLALERYKRSNPSDDFSRSMTAGGFSPEEQTRLYRQRAESMAAGPLMAVDGFDAQGNPTKTFMPRTGFGGAGGQPAPSGPAIGSVMNGYKFVGGNPKDRNSWVPMGGASPPGGGTFR